MTRTIAQQLAAKAAAAPPQVKVDAPASEAPANPYTGMSPEMRDFFTEALKQAAIAGAQAAMAAAPKVAPKKAAKAPKVLLTADQKHAKTLASTTERWGKLVGAPHKGEEGCKDWVQAQLTPHRRPGADLIDLRGLAHPVAVQYTDASGKASATIVADGAHGPRRVRDEALRIVVSGGTLTGIVAAK